MRGASRNATAPCVDSRRIDASGLHQRLQPRPARPRERAQACRGEGAVLVDERHDVRDRRQGDEIERPRDGRVVVAEEGARERVDDARAAQVGARVRRGPRRDDGTVRQRRGRPMVVGDDHVETELTRARDLLHRGDPAVDRQHEVDAVLGEALDRLRREPVPLLEAARQAPLDVRPELAQDEHGDGRGGDPVDVVVPVHADALARGHGGPDPLHRDGHVAEERRVVTGRLGVEERARGLRLVETAADEDGAVVSLTSSASASASTRPQSHGRVIQRPSCIAPSTVRTVSEAGESDSARHAGGDLGQRGRAPGGVYPTEVRTTLLATEPTPAPLASLAAQLQDDLDPHHHDGRSRRARTPRSARSTPSAPPSTSSRRRRRARSPGRRRSHR